MHCRCSANSRNECLKVVDRFRGALAPPRNGTRPSVEAFPTLVAFTPSFLFILLGARHFARLRGNRRVRAFLDGAGPAAIGAILGSAVPLALALARPWQYAVLAGAAVLLLALRRGVVLTLLCAGPAGVVAALAGAPVPQ